MMKDIGMIGKITLKILTTMEQKIIWTIVLTFGILNSFISCSSGNVDESYFEEYKYTNNSNYFIELVGYNTNNEYRYNLGTNEILSQKQELTFGKVDSIIVNLDSIRVIFNNERSVMFYKNNFDSEFNILDRDNYANSQVSDNQRLFEYNFTDHDYNNAE